MISSPFAAALAAATLLAALASPTLASVTAVEDLRRGAVVTVQGVVERFTDEDTFRLRDDTGSVRVYVGPNDMQAAVGEVVTVTGQVDDGWFSREIYARELVREDGAVVTFERSW